MPAEEKCESETQTHITFGCTNTYDESGNDEGRVIVRISQCIAALLLHLPPFFVGQEGCHGIRGTCLGAVIEIIS